MKKIVMSIMLTTIIFSQCNSAEYHGFATVSDGHSNNTSVEKLTTPYRTVYEAAKGTFWLTKNERRLLRDNSFVVSYLFGLPGWEEVESTGTMFKDRITCQVNNPQGKRATLDEIKTVLYK